MRPGGRFSIDSKALDWWSRPALADCQHSIVRKEAYLKRTGLLWRTWAQARLRKSRSRMFNRFGTKPPGEERDKCVRQTNMAFRYDIEHGAKLSWGLKPATS